MKRRKVVKIGKFANSLGIIELNIGGVFTEIRPKMGDKLKLLRLVSTNEKKGEEAVVTEMYDFIKNLFIREHVDEPKQEVEEYVEANLTDLIPAIMIGFKLTTKEQLDKKTAELTGKN